MLGPPVICQPRGLVAVAHTGGFPEIARRLARVRSAVGQAARALEAIRRQPLFDRTAALPRICDDVAGVGVRGEVELPPRPAPLGAVLLRQPLAGAAGPQMPYGAGLPS